MSIYSSIHLDIRILSFVFYSNKSVYLNHILGPAESNNNNNKVIAKTIRILEN